MTGNWQHCQGDYKPADVFEQGKIIVIARNIRLVENEIWQWEEWRMSKEDFLQIVATIDNQTSDSLFDLADMADENSEAINDLAEAIDDLNNRVSALEE